MLLREFLQSILWSGALALAMIAAFVFLAAILGAVEWVERRVARGRD